ncbi:MAG: hypothetical protein KAI47_12755, partial [Deltaproteobacteria bacterium]|nr:hypothetical protein [Deltaproteobacteria bacterium]
MKQIVMAASLAGILFGVFLAAPKTAEAQACPSSYRWSAYGHRCVRRCAPTQYYSYRDGRCLTRTRRYRACPQNHYWNSASHRCVRRAVCRRGSYYNYRDGRCRPLRVRCSAGSYYDAIRQRCQSRCPAGWRWTGRRCQSTCAPGQRYAPRLAR